MLVALNVEFEKGWILYRISTLNVFLLAFSGLVLSAAGCGVGNENETAVTKTAVVKAKKDKPSKPRGLPVKAQIVGVGKVVDEITAVGTLLAEEAVIIRPEIDGRISALHFKEGQMVEAGQKLVSIDNTEYEARLKAVEADLRTEKQRFERLKELHEQDFISKEALDIRKGAVEKLVALVDEARSRLDKTTIVAPFSGVVGLREVSPGAYVRAGANIVILENLVSVKADFRVPEVFLSKIRRNQRVVLRLDAYPGEQFRGRVYATQPVVDESTRTILMRARIKNRKGKLKPGMFARVVLLLETRPRAITVPEEALWPQGRDNFVYKVVDGKVVLTKVQIGKRQPGKVEIIKGLSEKDVVVTEGQIKLRNGAPVMVMGGKKTPDNRDGKAPADKKS